VSKLINKSYSNWIEASQLGCASRETHSNGEAKVISVV
jgi:hypothetical protein